MKPSHRSTSQRASDIKILEICYDVCLSRVPPWLLFSVHAPLSSSKSKHGGILCASVRPRQLHFSFYHLSDIRELQKQHKKPVERKRQKIHKRFIIYLISFNIKHSTAPAERRQLAVLADTCLKYVSPNINFTLASTVSAKCFHGGE